KTGNLPGVINDAGLIYTPAGPIAVVLLAQDVEDDEAVRSGMARLSAALFAYASGGGFGPVVAPPALWDPALDARLRAVVPTSADASVLVRHLGTGQMAVLGDADALAP